MKHADFKERKSEDIVASSHKEKVVVVSLSFAFFSDLEEMRVLKQLDVPFDATMSIWKKESK